MKNKKLLTRIFALLASLVLVVALAVPCFADAQTDDKDYVINSITFTDGNSAFQWLTENYRRVVRTAVVDNDGITYAVTSVPGLIRDSQDNITSFNFTVLSVSDVGSNDEGQLSSSVVGNMIDISAERTYFTLYPIIYSFVNQELITLDSRNALEIPNSQWSVIDFSFIIEYTAEYVPKEYTTRSGMFGQLYNILRDAIFGKDVALDDSQDFVLTQISTWMTYIVILLPLLAIGIILYRVFVR